MPDITYTMDDSGFGLLIGEIVRGQFTRIHGFGGMNFKLQDFIQTRMSLMNAFKDEYEIAHNKLLSATSAHEFNEALKDISKSEMQYRNNFSTFTSQTLATSIRHYLNDVCRLLEPLVNLLHSKYPDVRPGRKSINSYLKDLKDSGVMFESDIDFIDELYELWNDYKHRETRGLQVKPWRIMDNTVYKPTLLLPEVTTESAYFTDIEIDEFEKLVGTKLGEFVKEALRP